MEVDFLLKFSKDLDKISNKSVKANLLKFILILEGSKNLSGLPNVKKLSGHKSAYRLRIGDYRAGFFCEGETVIFARIVHRKDIYNLFP